MPESKTTELSLPDMLDRILQNQNEIMYRLELSGPTKISCEGLDHAREKTREMLKTRGKLP